jgi:hypothetical protein
MLDGIKQLRLYDTPFREEPLQFPTWSPLRRHGIVLCGEGGLPLIKLQKISQRDVAVLCAMARGLSPDPPTLFGGGFLI